MTNTTATAEATYYVVGTEVGGTDFVSIPLTLADAMDEAHELEDTEDFEPYSLRVVRADSALDAVSKGYQGY